MQFMIANKAVILAFLFATSEILSLIPSVKANGLFQLAFNAIKQAKPAAPQA